MSLLLVHEQQRSFRVVFMIELWERFGFYGMVALLVLYMTQQLGMSDKQANLTWGAAAALIYAAPALGGLIGDRLLGSKRTMLIGTFILAIGYCLLAWPTHAVWPLYLSLGIVVVGNGLFKPNAANLVRKIYEGDEARLDSAFTLYYMAVNVGSVASMLITPWVKIKIGWHAAFGVCSIGLILGLLNYRLMSNALSLSNIHDNLSQVKFKTFVWVVMGALISAILVAVLLNWENIALLAVISASLAAIILFINIVRQCSYEERRRLSAVFIFILQTILLFVFYQQMSTSLTLFALREVDPQMKFFSIPLFTWDPAQFQACNPMWIMLLSPVLAKCYNHFGRDGRDMSLAGKFAFGFILTALGFFVFGASSDTAMDGRASSWLIVAGYGLTAAGELLISGLGLAMISRYVPVRFSGVMIGIYYAATGGAQYLGSVVANLAQVVPNHVNQDVDVMNGYIYLFNLLGWLAAAGAFLSIILMPVIQKLTTNVSTISDKPVRI